MLHICFCFLKQFKKGQMNSNVFAASVTFFLRRVFLAIRVCAAPFTKQLLLNDKRVGSNG